jgi:competence protein ComEC
LPEALLENLTATTDAFFPLSLKYKRPCLLAALAFIFGILIGYGIPQPLPWFAPIGFVPLVAAMVFFRRNAITLAVMLAIIFLAGVFHINLTLHNPNPNHVINRTVPDENYTISAVVAAVLRTRESVDFRGRPSFILSFPARVEGVMANDQWEDLKGKIQVTCIDRKVENIEVGDRIKISGKIERIRSARNPGQFDYALYLRRQGYTMQMRIFDAKNIVVLDGPDPSLFTSLIFGTKQALHRRIENSSVSPGVKELQYAMLLGERHEIDPGLKQKLIDTSTVHILAISGLHVGILVLAALFILRLFLVPYSIAALVAIIVAFFYAVMTGFAPSAARAFIISAAFLTAPIFKREADSLNSLALSALVLLGINPLSLFLPGFQLSYVAVASIFLFSKRIEKFLIRLFRLEIDQGYLLIGPFRRGLYTCLRYPLFYFAMSLSAFIGVIPFAAFYFNMINPVSFISNIVVVPIVGLFVPVTFMRHGLGAVTPFLSGFLDPVNNVLGNWLLGVIDIFAKLAFFSLPVRSPSVLTMFYYYAVFLVVGFTPRLSKSVKGLVPIVGAAVITFGAIHLVFEQPAVEVTFLDVSHGEAIFIKSPGGKTMLVDGGSIDISDIGGKVIVPFLHWRGIDQIDYMLITHLDYDHYSGLEKVVNTLPVKKILWGVLGEQDSDRFEKLLSAIKKKKIPMERVQAGDMINLDAETSISIINPDTKLVRAGGLSDNNASVVVRLSYGESSLLLCGDIESDLEYLLINEQYNLNSTVLKVPHHGSDSASSPEFINAVNPAAVVISCGRYSRKPAGLQQVVKRYRKRGTKVYRTDANGAVHLRMYPDKVRLFTTLKGE